MDLWPGADLRGPLTPIVANSRWWSRRFLSAATCALEDMWNQWKTMTSLYQTAVRLGTSDKRSVHGKARATRRRRRACLYQLLAPNEGRGDIGRRHRQQTTMTPLGSCYLSKVSASDSSGPKPPTGSARLHDRGAICDCLTYQAIARYASDVATTSCTFKDFRSSQWQHGAPSPWPSLQPSP
jgi:hypothetical protein